MGVIYGLLTAAGFGGGDFFVTGASRRIGPMRCLYFIQIFGLAALVALALALRSGPPDFSATWVWLIALTIAVDFGGMYLLYRAFTVGSLAICSPIAASFAVVTGLLAFVSGERLPAGALAGSVILVAGVIVVSRGSGGAATLAGVPEALGAAVLLGIYFWAMDDVTAEMGWLWPVLINRAVMLGCTFAVLARSGNASPVPEAGAGSLLFAAALLDTMAQLALNLGLEHSYTTTTTALGSLYSAVSVMLAWIFFKERLTRPQWAGIGAILAGVLLIGH